MPFVVTLLASLVVAAAGQASGGMQATELDERTWEAGIRDTIAARYGVPPEAPRFAPGKRSIAFVRTPTPPATKRPSRRPPPPSRLLVVDPTGKLQASFAVVSMKGSHEPPVDLRFLDDARLVYEAVPPPPPPEAPAPKPAKALKLAKPRGRPAAKAASSPAAVAEKPPVPKRLFVIQPVRRGARAIRCEAIAFAFSPRKDRLAYVTGTPEASFLAIDGKRLYPRRGTTGLPSNVAWSPDGKSLAFLDVRADGQPRLVLEPDLEQPGSADTTWELPPTFPLEGMKVFWAGPSRLVVGKSVGAPAFSTSFELERPAM